jgi:hypothetical protein
MQLMHVDETGHNLAYRQEEKHDACISYGQYVIPLAMVLTIAHYSKLSHKIILYLSGQIGPILRRTTGKYNYSKVSLCYGKNNK